MKKDLYNKIFAPSDCLSQQLLIGYLKGSLNEHETHKVEEHLVDCELCSEALDGLMLVKNESVLGTVSADVKKVIHKQENKRRISPFGFWLAAAASVAIIITSVIAIKTVTTDSNKQLAVQDVKIPVIKDTLRSKENSTEESKTELTSANEVSIKSETKNSSSETKQIKTFTSQAPAQPEENSQLASVETATDESLNIEQKERAESDIVFSDLKTKEPAAKSQPVRTNSATEPVAVSLSEIKTISGNKSGEEKSNQENSEPIVFVQNLKIIDYSKRKGDDLLEPPANNTEAKYATPELKQETGAATIVEANSYKEIITPALEAFQQGKYSVTISLLHNILKENPSDLNAVFYSGIANYHLKNFTKSLEFLLPLTKKKDNTFFEEAKYYTALNYIQLNESIKARKLLQEIIEMNGFYKERSAEKLKELK